MKRFLLLAVLPLVLVALEPVNLIKDGGFENDSDVWVARSIISGTGNYDSTIYNRHDPDSVYLGKFCGSIDGRKKPSPSIPVGYGVEGYFYQVILYSKPLKDLDSLQLFHMPIFVETGNKFSAGNYGLGLYFTQPPSETFIEVWYPFSVPGSVGPPDTPIYKSFRDTIGNEGEWRSIQRDIKKDLVAEKGMLDVTELDTFLLYEASYMYPSVGWRGQKAFFDGIRLTGYADYDVGVKEILSDDSVWAGVYYKPVARIKSFGRQAADDFLAIAEIRQGEDLVWADTVPYTLPADTEDTLEFDSFPIPNALSYTLTIRTEMNPDECDEDDQLSKPLYSTAILENPPFQAVTLEVQSFTANPRIFYSLPQGQSGTISIFDAVGRTLESLTVQGSGQVRFPSALSSGVYFVKLAVGNTAITRKTVLLK